MGIAFFVGILVMDAMRRHPGNRPAFQGHGAADSHEIFHPSRRFITAVRQETVIAHPDAHTPGKPPQKKRDCEPFPAEHKQRCYSAEVKCQHEPRGDPVYRLLECPVVFETTHNACPLPSSPSQRSMGTSQAL